MNIVFGDKAIEVWRFQGAQSGSATLAEGHVSIDVRGDCPDDDKHFIVSVKNLHTGTCELTISLIAESYSLSPNMLFQEERSLLVLSHSSEILFIDTNIKKITRRLCVDYPIYYFFHYDICDSFVVVHELGMAACDRHGGMPWNWSSHEVVTETSRAEGKMLVKVFDGVRYVIDLNTGGAFSSQQINE